METSQLIYFAHKLTGLYMRAALAFNGLKKVFNLIPGGPLLLFMTLDRNLFSHSKLNCDLNVKTIY